MTNYYGLPAEGGVLDERGHKQKTMKKKGTNFKADLIWMTSRIPKTQQTKKSRESR